MDYLHKIMQSEKFSSEHIQFFINWLKDLEKGTSVLVNDIIKANTSLTYTSARKMLYLGVKTKKLKPNYEISCPSCKKLFCTVDSQPSIPYRVTCSCTHSFHPMDHAEHIFVSFQSNH